jgi:hypothetical protein
MPFVFRFRSRICVEREDRGSRIEDRDEETPTSSPPFDPAGVRYRACLYDIAFFDMETPHCDLHADNASNNDVDARLAVGLCDLGHVKATGEVRGSDRHLGRFGDFKGTRSETLL